MRSTDLKLEPCSRAGVWRPICVIGAFSLSLACQSNTRSRPEGTAAEPSAAPTESVALLSGSFTAVAKAAGGRARYASTHGGYQLILERAHVDTSDPVHVYLAALDEAPTTGSIEEAETKYDLGELKVGAAEQVFELPSAPDPALRVVVLWNPRFGVNLAQARLR